MIAKTAKQGKVPSSIFPEDIQNSGNSFEPRSRRTKIERSQLLDHAAEKTNACGSVFYPEPFVLHFNQKCNPANDFHQNLHQVLF